MLKKSVLRSMVGALVLSSSGMALAMEEHIEGAPLSTMVQAKQTDPSELARAVFDEHEIATMIRNKCQSPFSNETMAESIINSLLKSKEKHLECGFTLEFIKHIFKSSVAEYYPVVPNDEPRLFPLQILELQLGERLESSTIKEAQKTFLLSKLIHLFQDHPAFQDADAYRSFKNGNTMAFPSYKVHFETIFRFMEGMTEEQQTSTVSLLSPHVNLKNFWNFYPHQLAKGMDKYNVTNLNGEKKVTWLRRKLKDAGYFHESM